MRPKIMKHPSKSLKPVQYLKPTAFGIVMLLFSLLAGCGGKKETAESKSERSVENAAAIRGEVLKSLSESGINKQFSSTGTAFQEIALHDISRIHDYLKLNNKATVALQLGVYMSDLGYLVDYNKSDEAKQYFEGCVLLANDAGLNKQFSHAMELKFGEIISGNETLEKSLNRLYKFADDSSDDFKKSHAAALTGYYVEELYHLVVVAQSSQPSDSLNSEMKLRALQALLSQRQGISNLIGYFDHLQLKPEGIALYQDFLMLQSKYLSLNADQLMKETDPAKILQRSDCADILNAIKGIRNRITGR